MDDFKGQIVHPQTWPEDLDYKGKKVVVIGSGATAATLIPAWPNEAAHVTMLQRSPTYFIPGRNAIELADTLRAARGGREWIHEIVRRKILFDQDGLHQAARLEEPDAVKAELLAGCAPSSAGL
jgi:cation diffusion facilitator CzcD-associated flavoprotein CzcO